MTMLYCTQLYSYRFHHVYPLSFKLLNMNLVGNTLLSRCSIPFSVCACEYLHLYIYVRVCVSIYNSFLYIGLCIDAYHSVYIVYMQVCINIYSSDALYASCMYMTVFILYIGLHHRVVEFVVHLPFRCRVGMADFQKSS